MPRRQFKADLDTAQKGPLPFDISNIQAGDDDGDIVFSYGPGISITAKVTPDLGEYPKAHEYMLFAEDSAPPEIAIALNDVTASRKTILELLHVVSTSLSKNETDKDGNSQMQDSVVDDCEEAEGDEYEFDENEDDDFDHETLYNLASRHYPSHTLLANTTKGRSIDRAFRQRVREDLRAVKAAGFKAGSIGGLLDGGSAYVTVSVRIAKLGISDEAMEAWQLNPSEYLILIIHYPNAYQTNEELQGHGNVNLPQKIALRVVVGKRYKPVFQDAIKAFTKCRGDDRAATSDLPGPEQADAAESSIRDTFISRPLLELLQERLIPVLRFRSAGMDWQGAEKAFQHQVDMASTSAKLATIPDECYQGEQVNLALPNIVRSDHYASSGTTQFSFPLLAMQYVLRHFVRCTEFCLVCHRKLETDVEAIKPYVCDRNLCLYQYMALGLGPSIEHELIAQPYVVDLLISFCYNSAAARRLKDFPDGLSITVPPVDPSAHSAADSYGPAKALHNGANGRDTPTEKLGTDDKDIPKYEVNFEQQKRELLFPDRSKNCPVRRGDWIVLSSPQIAHQDLHCRVADTTYYPAISIDEPISLSQQHSLPNQGANQQPPHTPATTRPVSPAGNATVWTPATFVIYDQNFDEFEKDSWKKCMSICRLLDTLPEVPTMRDYLLKRHPADLKTWIERISPSALSLLRWIIVSNRACIMQVDGDDGIASPGGIAVQTTVSSKSQERCYGMPSFMQFRFAMGAPDKEQRFINEIRKTSSRLSLKYPTIFAWHGSPLYNWHMIIREGLHYKNTDHGRAYGHGVYHAKEASTSSGYSGAMYGAGGNRPGLWPNSVLRATSALALNEIVNSPDEFVSCNPYYVVQHLDWIQTRYLFVRVNAKSDSTNVGGEVVPKIEHPQDPARTPAGTSGKIVIPASAIKSGKIIQSTRTQAASAEGPSPFKKLKMFVKAEIPVVIDDESDVASVATDTEDLEILKDEPDPEERTASQDQHRNLVLANEAKQAKGPATDFFPGTLNFNTLPIMPVPKYASSGTTRRLMKDLQTLHGVQQSSPLGELGWYIEVQKIENVYQWIVELHSFHTFEVGGKMIPLAIDMKKRDIKSVVLEIRFHKDFPFNPPYVRVIRPQFLSFGQGGGGHVVIGGAMCMELLTNTGWSPGSSMESVLMQIRMAIASEPYARLNSAMKNDYGTGEAAEGYVRACRTHGWEVPAGFKEMAYGGPSQPEG